MAGMLELSDWEFKTTVMNMLKVCKRKFVQNSNSNKIFNYVCLCLTDDSNVTRDGREESALFCYYKVLTLSILLFIATLHTVLFKSGLGLVTNVYCTLRQPTTKREL